MYCYNIFSVKLDGSDEILHENDGYIVGITDDQKLIMEAGSTIKLLNTKTLKKKTLCEDAYCEYVENSTIYYHSYNDDKLVKINTNGENKKVLAYSTQSGSVQILDDYIYYLEKNQKMNIYVKE